MIYPQCPSDSTASKPDSTGSSSASISLPHPRLSPKTLLRSRAASSPIRRRTPSLCSPAKPRHRRVRRAGLGFLQVLRAEALGKPAVDGREEFVGVTGAALVAQQLRVGGRSAQLPGFRLLLPGPVERGDVVALRTGQVALEREQPAFDAESFSVVFALFAARPLDLGNDLID